MKEDELRMLRALQSERPKQQANGPFATEITDRLGINQKRALYVLSKWSDAGWWDYGTSLRSGWLTPLGMSK